MDEFKATVRELREERPAAAEVRLRLYGSAEGQSEVSLRVSPTGVFAKVQQEGPGQELALADLIAVVERELRLSLNLLIGR